MSRFLNSLVTIASVFAMQNLIAAPLAAVLKDASRDGHFVAIDAAVQKRAEALFVALLSGHDPAGLHEAAAALDMQLHKVSEPAAWVLHEKPAARQGRGLFAFRRDAPDYVDVLQVPHAFKDEHTREIGLALFAEGRFAAAAWNTVPRHYEQDGVRVDADMAHLDATWFIAFTRAVATVATVADRQRARSHVLQIHGFDQKKRTSAAAASADLILSAGHNNPPAALRRRWQCLQHTGIPNTALFPEGSRELGGTTNAQAATLRAQGFEHFIHAEMSRPLREQLLTSAAMRKIFLDCIHDAEK